MTDSKEYIEREALMQELEEIGGCDAPPDSWADGFDKGILSAIKHVEAQPADDVTEVRHGRWIEDQEFFKCSECGCLTDYRLSNFCPDCGAKMDGKVGADNA